MFSTFNFPLLCPRLKYEQVHAAVHADFIDIKFQDEAAGEDTEDMRVEIFIIHGRRHVQPIKFRHLTKSAAPGKHTFF